MEAVLKLHAEPVTVVVPTDTPSLKISISVPSASWLLPVMAVLEGVILGLRAGMLVRVRQLDSLKLAVRFSSTTEGKLLISAFMMAMELPLKSPSLTP
jgi:hypothetical protein